MKWIGKLLGGAQCSVNHNDVYLISRPISDLDKRLKYGERIWVIITAIIDECDDDNNEWMNTMMNTINEGIIEYRYLLICFIADYYFFVQMIINSYLLDFQVITFYIYIYIYNGRH